MPRPRELGVAVFVQDRVARWRGNIRRSGAAAGEGRPRRLRARQLFLKGAAVDSIQNGSVWCDNMYDAIGTKYVCRFVSPFYFATVIVLVLVGWVVGWLCDW